MGIVLQQTAPLQIIESTHGIEDLLEHAVLVNIGKKKIISYKIGWIVWYHDPTKGPDFGTGQSIKPEDGIEPGVVVGVPSQKVPGAYVKQGARKVSFFVSEAVFEDGHSFEANLSNIREQTE